MHNTLLRSGAQAHRHHKHSGCPVASRLSRRACPEPVEGVGQPRVPVRENRVREEFSRVKQLGKLPPSLRGWTLDVFRAVRQLDKHGFSLQELYAFEAQLKALHPQNENVRPKMRQQLQVLRDLGLLRFGARGNYEVV